jgi:hypothetical protein
MLVLSRTDDLPLSCCVRVVLLKHPWVRICTTNRVAPGSMASHSPRDGYALDRAIRLDQMARQLSQSVFGDVVLCVVTEPVRM